MTIDAATSEPSNATAATAQAPATAPPAAADAPKEDAGKRLERHIATALKAGKAEKPAAKAAPVRGPGGKFQKSGTSETASASATEGAASRPAGDPERAPAAKIDKPDEGQRAGRSPRELLEAGDLDAAFEAAFGKKPRDFKIDSRRWEEWRKTTSRAKEKLEKQAVADREAVANDRRQLAETLQHAQRELGPMLEARKLAASGDYAGALKAMFGLDVPEFQKKLLAQHHGKNPELESLRAELRAEREAREKREQEAERARLEAAQREQIQTYIDERRAELVDGDDPELAALAARPQFMKRVFQILQQHYDGSRTLPTAVAAGMVRDEIVAEFGGVFGRAPRDTAVPVETAQPGSKAASSGKAKPATSLPKRGAAEASTGRRRSVTEMLADYTDRAKAELGTTV